MKEFYLIIISVFISVTVNFFLTEKPPRIVVVDKDEIFRQFIIQVQKATSSDDEKTLMLRLEKYKNVTVLIDKKMEQIAREKNFIIFPKGNVLGGEDATLQAKQLLSDLMKERRANVKE